MPIHIEGDVAPSVAWGAKVSQRKAPGAMSAIAFIVSPVNPKVGVIFTSPVFSAMYSPLFILNFRSQTRCAEPIRAEGRNTRRVFPTSKMQRFDGRNHGFRWRVPMLPVGKFRT